MRPIRLEIEGLQSFREKQAIDFTTLSETGLFGIFGPTGSGKSTILDAITFALYGRVERACRGTQGIIHANMNHVRVSFTFGLKKGSREKVYRAERVYRRKKDTASCEPRIARLIEVREDGDIPLSDKATDVTARVEELIGLNHDDFVRAVVLPQNRFQEFLMLDTSKRREMLERIFYLEEYGQQLTDRVRKKADRLVKKLDRVRGVLSELGDASDEAVEEATRRVNAAQADQENASRIRKAAEAEYQSAKELWQLMQDAELLDRQEQAHATRKEEMAAKGAVLQKAIQAEGLMGMIQKHRRTAALLKEAQKELKQAEALLPATAAEMETIRTRQEKVRAEAEDRRPQLMEARTRLTDALSLLDSMEEDTRKLKGIIEKGKDLDRRIQEMDRQIRQKKLEWQRADQRWTDIRGEMNSLTVDPDYRQAMQAGASLQAELQTAERESRRSTEKREQLADRIGRLKQQEAERLGQLESEKKEIRRLMEKEEKQKKAKPGDREACMEQTRELNHLQSLCVELKREAEDMASFQKKEKKLLKDREKAVRKREKAEAQRKEAAEEAERCRILAEEREKALKQHSACLLARNLKEGEPCPVCGSLHHPQVAGTAGREDIAAAEQEAAAAGDRVRTAEEKLHARERDLLIAEEQIHSLENTLKQTQEEESGARDRCRRKAADLPERLRHCRPEQLQETIRVEWKRVEETLQSIDSWETSCRELQNAVQERKEALSKQDSAAGSIITQRKVNEENLSQAEEECGGASRKWEEKKAAFDEFLQDWPGKSPSGELKRIADQDRKFRSRSREAEQLQKTVKESREILDQWTEERSGLEKQAEALALERKNREQSISGRKDRIRQASPDGRIREGIQQINKQLDAYTREEKQCRERQESLQSRYQEQMDRQSTLRNQKNIHAHDYDREEAELKDARAERGFSDDREAEKAALPRESRQKLEEECREYRKETDNLQAQRRILENRRKGRILTEEQWNRIAGRYQQAVKQDQSDSARYEVEKLRLQDLMQKHRRWVAWNGVQEKLSGKLGLLEQIQKLLKGDKGKDNSFVDYVAEERLRYVAAEASEILGHITRYKYALELDVNEGFRIRDNGNGGISRMVTSLSGGEIFLTSLSLALALSEQIQLKGQSPLEFFFLDEGFGALDEQLLNTVMDSLERLSTKERVIGLISHVSELQDRISRRLIVDPPSSRGEGSRVRIVKA